MNVDPASELAKLEFPVLIVQGTEDLQVTVSDAKLLKQSVLKSKLVIIDKMNHALKKIPKSDTQFNLASYQRPNKPWDTELVRQITYFLVQ